ncbi:vesicle transport through interaction with t-SNAREs homolog 1B-like [Liolophura sinensis]|uniref:vesicle transport through interaction with t-SNAREs homolog 1B-like n=1 Tax=Liolophura sinensis TaxID=3198878 RepID=UPI0031585265
MSSERFETLADDLTSLLDELRNKVDLRIPNYSGEERKNAIRQAERTLEQANFLLQDMEEQAKLAPISYRTQMLGKVRNHRRALEDISKSLKRGQTGTFGADNHGFDRDDRIAASQRSRLMQGTESLNRTSESIARSHRVAAETDQIGVEIIEELGQQRESLVRTKDRLHGTDSNLRKSRKILRSMVRRVMSDKMILIMIILVQLGCLGGVIYWKFFS